MAQGHEPGSAVSIGEQWAGRTVTVTAGGEIDMNTIDGLRDCLAAVLKQHPGQLIVDLAAVDFLDSSAIHALTQARHVLPGDCPMVLRSPQPMVRRVFELTGLDEICAVE